MLLLTRREQDKLYISHHGEVLEILITSVGDKQVRLGFTGSQGFNIQRDNIKKTKPKVSFKGRNA